MSARTTTWAMTGVACLLLLAGCEAPRSEATRVEGAALRLAASLEPTTGRVGENRLWLELVDAEGRPVAEAAPEVVVHMVAMGAMPAMGGPASVEPVSPGRYRADFDLEMGGTWIVEIEARGPGGARERFSGSLTVGSPGVRLRAESAPSTQATGSDVRHPAEVAVDPARLQTIGVRTTPVLRAPLSGALRAVGRVVYDETRLADVSPKVEGWIEELHADAVGMRVEHGEVLFSVYSPELYAAQEELLQALRSQGELSASLVRAARNRLRLLGLSPRDVEAVVARGRAVEALPFRAPATGFVIEKNVVAGSAIRPGERLMRIAPLDPIWVEIDLYESDLPRIRPGQEAQITLSHVPGRVWAGSVAFVYPYVRGETRTARARIELPNEDLALRPDMFANVSIEQPSHEGLLVPESAVLHAGARDFVFVSLGGGRFRPVAVTLGARSDGRIEVRTGLDGSETVVSSGTFLIASESRLRAGIEQW